MEWLEWFELIGSLLIGLATAIPLVIKLVEYVKKAAKEKNWGAVLALVMQYMSTAEEKFDNGADRKEWVLDMVEQSSTIIEYDIDMTVIADLVDKLCTMSKKVNAATKK